MPSDGEAGLAEGETFDQHEKKWQYRLDVVTHDYELEKIKAAELEQKCAELKKRLEEGDNRSDKIKRISAMVADFKHQLEEAHAEIDRLLQENQALKSQLQAAGVVSEETESRGTLAAPREDKVNLDLSAAVAQPMTVTPPELAELKAENAMLLERLRKSHDLQLEKERANAENAELRASLLAVRGQLEQIQQEVAQHVCHRPGQAPEATHAMSHTSPEQTLVYDLYSRSHYERIMTDIEKRDPGHLARVNEDMMMLRTKTAALHSTISEATPLPTNKLDPATLTVLVVPQTMANSMTRSRTPPQASASHARHVVQFGSPNATTAPPMQSMIQTSRYS